MSERPALRRSRSSRIFGGVCGGLAAWSGQSVALIRIAYVLISILSAAFPGLAVYLVLWLIIPEEPAGPDSPRRNTARNIGILVAVIAALIVGLVASVLGVRYAAEQF